MITWFDVLIPAVIYMPEPPKQYSCRYLFLLSDLLRLLAPIKSKAPVNWSINHIFMWRGGTKYFHKVNATIFTKCFFAIFIKTQLRLTEFIDQYCPFLKLNNESLCFTICTFCWLFYYSNLWFHPHLIWKLTTTSIA
jgi:hypothetical protein